MARSSPAEGRRRPHGIQIDTTDSDQKSEHYPPVIGDLRSANRTPVIEGYDSSDGIKGRWMLAGVYGPQPKTSAALKTYHGFPVRQGESRLEATADGKRATGSLNGQDLVTAEIKPVPNGCAPGAGVLNYVTMARKTEQIVVNRIPF